ncbi:alpha/beta hydrolase family protein [Clavibacter sepedonicus]|uniref:alpha/beta hydrolase family protein n=1 Tax=Clavibacter sepedonicus TaxID=31964 RepID=UPI003DA65E9F
MPNFITRRRFTAVAAVAMLATLGVQSTAQAATASYAGNGDPTLASISSMTGPEKAHKTRVLPTDVTGFGGGTIFYPTNTQGKTVGAVVLAPGFTGLKGSVGWYGPALASQGFIVFNMDTLDPADFPNSRATQIGAAIDYLKKAPVLKGRLDPSRIAVAGYSMGGGGALKLATTHPELKAVLAFAPYYASDDLSTNALPEAAGITTPTLIITGQKDDLAIPATFGKSYYDTLPKTTPRQYLELAGATHEAPQHKNTDILSASVAFLKTFVDNDERYAKFTFPSPQRPSLSASISTR